MGKRHDLAMLLQWLCTLIGNLTGTIILVPHPIAIGETAEQIYFALLKARREKKRLVVLSPYELPWRLRFPLANVEILRLESEHRVLSLGHPLCIVGNVLLTLYFGFFRTVNVLMYRIGRPLHESLTIPRIGQKTLWKPEVWMRDFSWQTVENYRWCEQLQTLLPIVLAQEKKRLAEQLRLQMGLPDGAWFACLHVRESGFYNDAKQSPERNADIMKYIPAMEEITRRGGWVVRMGDASMTRLPPMERVIDYPFTQAKNALMDMYLISECRVYMGMQSGIYDVAAMFQRPIILMNMGSWMFPFPQKKGDIGIFKHVYSKSRNRYLSIREWLAEPWEANSYWPLGQDYVLHENDAEELRTVVKEFFDRGEGWQPTPLQRELNELRLQSGRKLLDTTIIPGNAFADAADRYRLASRLDSAIGVLGSDFLSANLEKGSRNTA